MNVPFANQWRKETDELRKIALGCGLTEELKWGKPCFTFRKKNVAIVIPLKESCAFSPGSVSIHRPGGGSNSPPFRRLWPYDRR